MGGRCVSNELLGRPIDPRIVKHELDYTLRFAESLGIDQKVFMKEIERDLKAPIKKGSRDSDRELHEAILSLYKKINK